MQLLRDRGADPSRVTYSKKVMMFTGTGYLQINCPGIHWKVLVLGYNLLNRKIVLAH